MNFETKDFEFEVGDLVQLKSGGPIMTIMQLSPIGIEPFQPGYICQWFSGKDNNKLNKDFFSTGTLIAANLENKE